MDSGRIHELYELTDRGDFDTPRSWFTETYRHHIPVLAVELEGIDQAFNLAPEPFKAINVYRFEDDLIAECWVLLSIASSGP